jgi:beta-barrel assembly-enhancing protease
MSGFFYNLGYNLGRLLGPKLREANWVFRSLTGTEAEAIQAEFAVGRDLVGSFAGQFETCSDSIVNDFVTDLGARLASRVGDRHRRFSFRVVQAQPINAFALPGGFVYLTHSLVDFCDQDRDELAFILGHEMGHIVGRHAIDRLVANTALRAAISRLTPVGGVARQSVARLASTLFQQSYSQDQELEADGYGVLLARSAGFDPHAAIRLLDRLGAELDHVPVLGSYLASHPPMKLRVQNLKRLLCA